ncbi:hypothetical protein NFI96_030225 [Prochilodus magdalenae]|nr:hypothetical protein NFI96_030225 [Prochilodus magdalenae]
MESYEQFHLRSLAKLQSERKNDKSCLSSGQYMDTSLICFHGRTVLSPVLSEKQRREMAQYRQTSARLEAEMQTRYRNNLFNQVQKILDNRENAFTVPEPSKPTNNVLTSNQLMTPLEVLDKNPKGDLEMDIESENEEISLQSLLRRSREYIEKEHAWRGSKVGSKSPVSSSTTTESLSNKENENGSPVVETDNYISSYNQYHSPLSPDQLKTQPVKKPRAVIDPVHGLDSLPACPPHSLLNTEASLSPRPHRGRPRPVSTGDILLSYTDRANEPGITARGKSPEGVFPPGLERRLLEVEGLSGCRRASHSDSSPMSERGSFISTPDTGHDLTETAFRRRCHTLDSNLGLPQSLPINRSQERVPRFMAGVPQRTPPRRSPPVQLNTTFTLASPASPSSLVISPILNPELSASSCHIKQQLTSEGNSIISMTLDETMTDEVQWRVQAAGEMQRCMKEEQHALQISLLKAEQEREQQRIQQASEQEEREWRLRDLGGVCTVVGELGNEWKGAESFSSPCTSCPISPAEISPGCITPSIGLASPITSGIITPCIPPPVYVWGLNRGVIKSRNRLSQTLRWCSGSNAWPHVARVCRQFLENKGINTIDWPTGLPDLTPIERRWDIMFRSIRRHQVALQTVQELSDALVQIWEEIPQDTICHLIRSMPPRCIQAGGSHTKNSARLKDRCIAVILLVKLLISIHVFLLVFLEVLNPEQQRALCRLTAVARGFLTRQLLKTEKVKHLCQTVKDTQEFISSFHKEAPQKRNTLSDQDLSLQERVRAQLRAALFDIHDIFFEMTLDERLALLQQDRELRTERKLREMEKAKSPKEKMILSAATQKVLDRKKQRVGESPGQTRRMQQKPKSPLTNRSLHRKTPEDRLKRSDGLKKQHSLG